VYEDFKKILGDKKEENNNSENYDNNLINNSITVIDSSNFNIVKIWKKIYYGSPDKLWVGGIFGKKFLRVRKFYFPKKSYGSFTYFFQLPWVSG
jgi:hypothetical protein